MNKFEKTLTTLGIAMIILIGIIAFTPKDNNLGYAPAGEGYNFKNITLDNASTTSAVAVRGGNGILGSVVINTTSATALSIYDGNGTTTGATLIATFPATAVVGTYTFDALVKNGIVLAGSVGFTGNYTITYR